MENLIFISLEQLAHLETQAATVPALEQKVRYLEEKVLLLLNGKRSVLTTT